jgi:5-methyltetrahydrofolate--homocysteine methyltransferase
MIDREAFEAEQHAEQQRLRDLYEQNSNCLAERSEASEKTEVTEDTLRFPLDSYMTEIPADIPVQEIPLEEVLPHFDWKMFYAIWGVKYGSAAPEAMELMQLRRDAEDELALADFKIMLTARFFPACTNKVDEICFEADGKSFKIPMMRQEGGKNLSLSDFVIPAHEGRKAPFGMFAISVHKKSTAHEHGCCCPACSNAYEDMIGKTVRMTLAEAASKWLDASLLQKTEGIKLIKPAAGYSSCPDHTLKGDIIELLCGHVHWHHDHIHNDNRECEHCHSRLLGIELTESYSMTPEASICGMIFIHPEAEYPQIRRISQEQYDSYASRRGMDSDKARRFLGHLLK